ncbi:MULTISPECIES: hypothetical protein [unclassified Streptomyces]|uniref:hypothetical protein n=1 Tax=unclassified Streptomyces TaxID=2593676 RepID=UPI0035D5EA78
MPSPQADTVTTDAEQTVRDYARQVDAVTRPEEPVIESGRHSLGRLIARRLHMAVHGEFRDLLKNGQNE